MKKLIYVFTTVFTFAVTNLATAQNTVVDIAAGNADFSLKPYGKYWQKYT